MQLYLVQHGDSKPEEEDPERPLSDVGSEETEKIAQKLASAGIDPDRILHSPKLRARQTAEILAKHLGKKPEEAEGLKPMDGPKLIKKQIDSMEETASVMLVGHLPHMEKLASLLITKKEEPSIHISRYSSPLCIEKKDGTWQVKWYLLPELL